MVFSKHYQGELDYLLEMGRAFSRTHADARHLAERSGDPDVERLLEGFAFLAAKIHERVDNALPDVIHRLTELLSPQYLRPVPSCTIVQFEADLAAMRGVRSIPVHTELTSHAVEGVSCQFRSTRKIDVLPLEVVEARVNRHSTHTPKLQLEFRTSEAGRQLIGEHGRIEFFVHGEASTATMLLLWLLRYCTGFHISDYGESTSARPEEANLVSRLRRPPNAISLQGFGASEPLLPWSDKVLDSYRLLAEYFTLPQKFRFFSIENLHGLELENDRFRIEFEFNRPPDLTGNIDASVFRLHCTPAINLFETSAEPISVDTLSSPKMLRGAGLAPDQIEVFDVVSVVGIPEGRRSTRAYHPFFQFRRDVQDIPAPFYVLDRRASPLDDRLDTYIRVIHPARALQIDREVLSVELLCTNRQLTHELKVGDICKAARGSAVALPFRNITAPTQPTRPPLDGELHWRLTALMGLNRASLADGEHLRALLDLYNGQAELQTAQAAANRNHSESIRSVWFQPTTRLLQGAPVRGSETTVEIDESRLGPGEAFLFGQLLDEIFAAHANLNSFNELHLKLHPSGQELRWTPRGGTHAVL